MERSEKVTKAIDALKMCHKMIVFNPMTGKTIDPLFLNEDNRDLYYGIESILQYIEQLESLVPRWISVEEKLPGYYTDVAVIVRNGDASWYKVAYLAVGGIWALEGGRRIIGVVTHWMPLPPIPKEE